LARLGATGVRGHQLKQAASDLHGYSVIQAVRERSEGRIQLQTGPFYRHLRKLMDDRLVNEAPSRPVDDDPRRGSGAWRHGLAVDIAHAARRLRRSPGFAAVPPD